MEKKDILDNVMLSQAVVDDWKSRSLKAIIEQGFSLDNVSVDDEIGYINETDDLVLSVAYCCETGRQGCFEMVVPKEQWFWSN